MNETSFSKNKDTNNDFKAVDKNQFYSSGDSWVKHHNKNNVKKEESKTSLNSFTDDNNQGQNSFKNEIISEKIANSLNNSNNKVLETEMSPENLVTKIKKIQQKSQNVQEEVKILAHEYKPETKEIAPFNSNSPPRAFDHKTKGREDVFPNSITFSTSNEYTNNYCYDKDQVILTSNKTNPFKNDLKESIDKSDFTKKDPVRISVDNERSKEYLNPTNNNTIENFNNKTNFLSDNNKTDYIVDLNSVELKSKLIK